MPGCQLLSVKQQRRQYCSHPMAHAALTEHGARGSQWEARTALHTSPTQCFLVRRRCTATPLRACLDRCRRRCRPQKSPQRQRARCTALRTRQARLATARQKVAVGPGRPTAPLGGSPCRQATVVAAAVAAGVGAGASPQRPAARCATLVPSMIMPLTAVGIPVRESALAPGVWDVDMARE